MYFRNDQYIYPINIFELVHFNIIISLIRHEKPNVDITNKETLFLEMFHVIPPIHLTLPKYNIFFFFCDPGYKFKCFKFNHFEPCC